MMFGLFEPTPRHEVVEGFIASVVGKLRDHEDFTPEEQVQIVTEIKNRIFVKLKDDARAFQSQAERIENALLK